MISNIIKQAASTENTEQLKTFWLKKYTELTENNYFVLSPKTIELTLEKEVIRPATPFGDLVLMSHLDESGEINENLLQNNIEIAVRLLDACLDIVAFDKNSAKVINQYRKIGLGVADFGQYYKNLKRETNEAEEIEYIGNLVSNNAYRSSESLSEEKGICQSWDNIKKTLRDKPFEYWYNTENGDIKTSNEMVANFDQKRIEASDFEIVPRRNSHMMLFPAVDEWQVWSDRSPMTISQLNSHNPPVNPNLINLSENQQSLLGQTNLKTDSNDLDLANNYDSNQISNQALQNNIDGKSKTGGTVISFPKNKTEKTDQIQQQVIKETDQEKISEEKSDKHDPNLEKLKKVEIADNEEEKDLLNLSNSPKIEHSKVLELEVENLPSKTENKPDFEMQNSQNFFEKPVNLEKSEIEKDLQSFEPIEQSRGKSQNFKIEDQAEKEIDKEKISENQLFEEESSKDSLQNQLKDEDEQRIEHSSQNTSDKSLIKEIVSTFGQSKFVELKNENKNSSKNLEEIADLTTKDEIKNQENPLVDEFQLGELVRIVKKDSPSFGQIQQIIEINENSSDNEIKNSNLKLSGLGNQNLIFEQKEIEPMDLHSFLDQTNFANSELAKGENEEKFANSKNQPNSEMLTQSEREYLSTIKSYQDEIKKINEENRVLKQEKTQDLDKIKNLETQNSAKNLEKDELSKIIQAQKTEIDELKKELNSTRQELKNMPSLGDQRLFNQNFDSVEDKANSSFDNTNQPNNHTQELQNLLHQNNPDLNNEHNSKLNTANKPTNNFFKLQNKFISFMSKYSLQLQQLASTSGDFQLGDILITLQYDGGGVKLVSASGDKLSKELKHMVDTVLGIVNKALAFGVPAKELAIQMKLEPKDDQTETPLNHILAVVAAALEEAPGQIQNLKADSLFGIDKKDVENFTTTVKSDSMSILMSKLQELKAQKLEGENNISNFERNSDNSDNKSKENPKFETDSSQKFEPKNEEKPQNNTINTKNSDEGENPFSSNPQVNVSNKNSQNDDNSVENSKQEEKPRSFFGGFGGRN